MNDPIDSLSQRFTEMFPEAAPSPPPPSDQTDPDAPEKNSGEAPADPPPGSHYLRRTEHAKVGYDLDLSIPAERILEAAQAMDEAGFAIDMVSAVDWPEEEQFEVVYDFLHFEAQARVVVRTRVSREKPEIHTLSEIFPGANWHERETAEFFGIQFTGHPNPIHLLLPEDFEGYPLRKDFQPAE